MTSSQIPRIAHRRVQGLLLAALLVLAATAVTAVDGAVAAAAVPGPHSLTAFDHTCSLTAAGAVKCWGRNDFGQLGTNSGHQDSLVPVQVWGLASGVAAVAAAAEHTCALTTAGGVKCWGFNFYGELGDGTTDSRDAPVNVVGLTSGVAAIAAGGEHTCALTTAGGVKCWGFNGDGELGTGTTINHSTPVNVSGLSTGVSSITIADAHTCAVTTAGGAKCWGENAFGEIGDGSLTNRLTPVNVSGLTSGVRAIGGGANHTCAVTTAGGAKCWGKNTEGELGDGTMTQRTTPVDVVGLTSGVGAVAGGFSHTCALTTAGGLKCWGANFGGALGDGTTTQRTTPVDVVGLTSGVATVAAGSHTCAVTGAGAVKCWGMNPYGQLGNGTTIGRLTPVDVSGSFYRTECPTLIAAAHTTFTLTNGYAVGSVAMFAADSGYTLVGGNLRNCQANATWDGSVPTAVLGPIVLPGTTSVLEGNAGTTSVHEPLSLSIASSLSVTVQWTTKLTPGAPVGQADPATDFTPASGTVTFAPGETAKTVTISVNGDTLVEPDEWLLVSFNHPTNAKMGGYYGLGFALIVNDD